jgi:hypothetical protein|uniref:Agenet domain-containing protein n=1 Tax=Populus trichocarpa TaxID=3694 RepID=B9MYP5_POPTR
MEFHGGDKVEVCSEEEGFLGSYYAATAVKKLEANSYAVQYENLVEEEDMSKQLIETHRKPSAKTHCLISTLLNGLNRRTHPTPKPLTRPSAQTQSSTTLLLLQAKPLSVDGVTIS